MYLWKINELVLSIKAKEFTEQNKFHYLMIYLGVYLLSSLLTNASESNNTIDIIGNVLYALITIIGTYACYLANGGNVGNDFLGKYFSIGCVVSIRTTIFFIPLIFALIIYGIAMSNNDIGYSIFEIIILTFLEFIIFKKMYVYIREANS